MASRSRSAFVLVLVALVAACGGGGGKKGASSSTTLSVVGDASLAKGRTLAITATVAQDGGAPTDCTAAAQWSSSDPAVASVAAGVVTAVNVGRTEIAASCSGQVDTVVLHVTPAQVVSLSLTPLAVELAAGPGELPAGLQEQLTADATLTDGSTVTDAGGQYVLSWTSDDPGAFAVSSRGVITATGSPGQSATITVTHPASGAQASVSRTVSGAGVTLASAYLQPQNPSTPLGTEGQFVVVGTFSDGKMANVAPSFAFTSSSPSRASFDAGDPAGYVSTLAVGSTTIQANPGPGVPTAAGHPSTTLTVTPPVVAWLDLAPPYATVVVGQKLQLADVATLTDLTQQAATVSAWTSSVPGVATVAGGVVSAVAPGYSTIGASATTGQGTFGATMQIEVVKQPATPLLSYVALSASAAKGAGALTGTVALTSPATADTAVALTTSEPLYVAIPASVTIPAGARSATFSLTMSAPPLTTQAMIGAACCGVEPKNVALKLLH